jgi:hypothetical protein
VSSEQKKVIEDSALQLVDSVQEIIDLLKRSKHQ